MTKSHSSLAPHPHGLAHDHAFLGASHVRNERRTWMVIALCTVMMVVEIVGGMWFGSIALVADGWHMSTHASALLLAALAYSYARRHADDRRFTFGTGKFGDLAGFTSAIVLAMIALLVGYEAALRLVDPVPIDFAEAIPIAVLGLLVNVASALLLGAGGHDHQHHHHDDPHPARRVHDHDGGHRAVPSYARHRDHNMRAAVVHVMADAAVSVLVIIGLSLGRWLGWAWMDPVAGICGAIVIAAWSWTLIRDTGAILLDMNPDRELSERMRAVIEAEGDRLTDLHLWRLGPGHLGAIVSVATVQDRGPAHYRALLRRFEAVSHLTVEVHAA